MTDKFDEAQKRYMRDEGCPYCRSKLEYGEFEMNDGELFRASYCTGKNCNAEFQETWTLAGVAVDCTPYQR